MIFVKDLDHLRSVSSHDEAARKHLKRLIDTRLLMDDRTGEESKIIFGRF